MFYNYLLQLYFYYMNFDSPLFLICIIGAILLLTGLILLKFPPKRINGLYGYRTTRSMSSQKNWDFAQKYSAKLMAKSGTLLILTGVIGSFTPIKEKIIITVSVIFFLISCIMLFYKTEQGMKKLDNNE